MRLVNEKSSCTIVLTFTDEDGAEVTPQSGTYSLEDVASGTMIKEATAFIPSGPTHEIEITSLENQILDPVAQSETRRVTVTFLYGADKQGPAEYKYRVKNLQKVS